MNKEKLTLPKTEALAILWGDQNEFEVIKDDLIDTTRWSSHHELVVRRKSDGKFFVSEYSRGLTESQDESPWEYDDEVEFNEVFKTEKTVIVYE